jgi:hypothetical protein
MPDVGKVKNPLVCKMKIDGTNFNFDGAQYSDTKN